MGRWQRGAEGPFGDAEVAGVGSAGCDDLGEHLGGLKIPDAVGEDYVVVRWTIFREGGEEGDCVCGEVESDSGAEGGGFYVSLGLGKGVW